MLLPGMRVIRKTNEIYEVYLLARQVTILFWAIPQKPKQVFPITPAKNDTYLDAGTSNINKEIYKIRRLPSSPIWHLQFTPIVGYLGTDLQDDFPLVFNYFLLSHVKRKFKMNSNSRGPLYVPHIICNKSFKGETRSKYNIDIPSLIITTLNILRNEQFFQFMISLRTLI